MGAEASAQMHPAAPSRIGLRAVTVRHPSGREHALAEPRRRARGVMSRKPSLPSLTSPRDPVRTSRFTGANNPTTITHSTSSGSCRAPAHDNHSCLTQRVQYARSLHPLTHPRPFTGAVLRSGCAPRRPFGPYVRCAVRRRNRAYPGAGQLQSRWRSLKCCPQREGGTPWRSGSRVI
jgi:hypothetical protein